MRRTFQILLLALFTLTSVSAFAAGAKDAKKVTRKMRTTLEETQKGYDAALRWGEIEDALPFLDPEYTKANPMSDLELSRYEQVKIASYQGGSNLSTGDWKMGRNVDVSIINKNTQTQRSARVAEIWRWDPEDKRWLLTSGLPDLWSGR